MKLFVRVICFTLLAENWKTFALPLDSGETMNNVESNSTLATNVSNLIKERQGKFLLLPIKAAQVMGSTLVFPVLDALGNVKPTIEKDDEFGVVYFVLIPDDLYQYPCTITRRGDVVYRKSSLVPLEASFVKLPFKIDSAFREIATPICTPTLSSNLQESQCKDAKQYLLYPVQPESKNILKKITKSVACDSFKQVVPETLPEFGLYLICSGVLSKTTLSNKMVFSLVNNVYKIDGYRVKAWCVKQ